MGWPIIWHASIPQGPWQPGWAYPLIYSPSRHFINEVASKRPPISVAIPCRGSIREGIIQCTSFCVDSHPTKEPDGGWTVNVDGPMIDGQQLILTVHPSINAVGIYHGWITDGILSDDIDH